MASFTQNVFSEVRQPGDIDLVQVITGMLMQNGHPAPEAWQNNDTIAQAKVAAPKLQRFLINRHWRTRLGACETSTVAERFCLMEDGSHEEYLQLFEKGVLPTLVKLAL